MGMSEVQYSLSGSVEVRTVSGDIDILGIGASGTVELISPTRVLKSAWKGREEKICRQDIEREAKVYRCLGDHPCIPKFYGYSPEDSSITLEYMSNGTLREYIQKNNGTLTISQRLQWALAAADGLALLHSADILHCDFSPRNLLLDSDLELKVADFGCSATKESPFSSGEGSVRFYHPRDTRTPPTFDIDIFAFGSTLYEVMTGKIPYEDVATRQVSQLYSLHQFPDLHGVPLGSVVLRCWLLDFESTKELYNHLQSYRTARGS